MIIYVYYKNLCMHNICISEDPGQKLWGTKVQHQRKQTQNKITWYHLKHLELATPAGKPSLKDLAASHSGTCKFSAAIWTSRGAGRMETRVAPAIAQQNSDGSCTEPSGDLNPSACIAITNRTFLSQALVPGKVWSPVWRMTMVSKTWSPSLNLSPRQVLTEPVGLSVKNISTHGHNNSMSCCAKTPAQWWHSSGKSALCKPIIGFQTCKRAVFKRWSSANWIVI